MSSSYGLGRRSALPREPYVKLRLANSFLARITQLREIFQLLYEREYIPSLRMKFSMRLTQIDRLRARLMERRIKQLGL